MRARVTMPFRDKYTNIIYEKGQVIEVTKERYEELSSTALGSFVEAIDANETTEIQKKELSEKKKITQKKQNKSKKSR